MNNSIKKIRLGSTCRDSSGVCSLSVFLKGKRCRLTPFNNLYGKNIILTVCMIIFSFLSAVNNINASDINLIHTPPVNLETDQDTPVTLDIVGLTDNIESITLHYREIGNTSFAEETIHRSDIRGNEVTMTLPPLTGMASGYEYYFSVNTTSATLTYPESNPRTNPLRVRRTERVVTPVTHRFLLLNNQTTVFPEQDLVFGASFYSMREEIDINTLQVFLNNNNITPTVNISSPLIVYKRTNPQPGDYRFQIRAMKKNGQRIHSPIWQFRVVDRPSFMERIPLDLSGNLSLTSNVRSFSKSDSTEYSGSERNDASLRFNLLTRRNRFSMRSRLYITSYESSNKQPLNRYSFQLSAPYIDLYLLDQSPNYGSFVLSNQNVRGIGTRVYSEGLSISGVFGQTARAIDGKEITNDELTSTYPDRENHNETEYSRGTFQRNATALRIGLGESEGLSLGLGFSKIKDDVDSLEEIYFMRKEFTETDTLSSITYLNRPKDNLVVGFDARLSLDNHRFIAGTEMALSLYNSNIAEGVMTKEELEDYLEGESIPFDPESLERYIIINQNIEPITMSIPPKENLAFKLYMRWFLYNNMINVSYSEIGAGFNSLGAGFLQNDATVLTISDYITMFNNRLSIDAGFNIITDNFSQRKNSTTTTTSWYLQTLVRPGRNLPYFRSGANFSTNNNKPAGDESAAPEQHFEKVDQEMNSYNFGIGYHFEQIPNTSTSVDLSLDFSDDKDLTDDPYFDVNRNSYRISISNSLHAIPLTTRFSFSNSTHKNNILEESTRNYSSIGLRNEYSFFEGAIVPFLNINHNSFSEHDNTLIRYDLGTELRPYTQTTINTRIELTNFTDKEFEERDYSSFGWYLNASKWF